MCLLWGSNEKERQTLSLKLRLILSHITKWSLGIFLSTCYPLTYTVCIMRARALSDSGHIYPDPSLYPHSTWTTHTGVTQKMGVLFDWWH